MPINNSHAPFKFELKTEIISRAIVFNSQNQLLLVSTDGESWHFPGGMLDGIESLEECAKRETLEEAGIEIEIQTLKATSDNLKDCRSDFKNFLRSVMFYFSAKTDAILLNENHCDIDSCIKYRKFFTQQEFLSIKTFFPKRLQIDFKSLLEKQIMYFPFEIFSKDNLNTSNIIELLKST